MTAFLDRYALPAGRAWQPELELALASCRAVLVLLGPTGIGGWQHREIQLGLDRQTAAAKSPAPFPVIPVLLPNLQPDDVPLGTFLALNTWVDLRTGLDEPEPLKRLIAAARGRAIDGLTSDLTSLRPYRGLLAFREQDAGLFFGRERFVEELVAKIRQRSTANVVAVLGRSGSGKSSVVFAGLFPALRQEKGAGQQAVWQILDLRPGAEPLHALIETFDPPDEGLTRAKRLASINGDVELLRQRKLTLAQLVRDHLEDDPGTTRLLLYVDQWEELYTQAQPRDAKTDEEKARAADARLFVDLALDAAASSPCTLVLSVRSDFYPDLQTHDRLRAAVQDCQVSLGPMSAAELTRAIEEPARAVGGSVEPELTKELLRDLGLDPGGAGHADIGKLPLLEYALEQAWAKAQDGTLGMAHYRGLEQALEERANKVYGRLPPERQAAAKRLFVSLVTPGEGREDTRARIALAGDALLEEVAAVFAGGDARLIVTGDEAAGARTVEVSHEALIRHWDRLRVWIDENRANLRTRSTLVAARAEWLKQKQDRSLLIEPGLRLEAARRLRDQPGDVETADLQDYLDASFRADTRRKLRRKLGLAASAATAALMALLAAWGWYQYTLSARRAVETTAALIGSRLDFEQTDDPRSTYAVQALWKLATDPSAVRNAFLHQLSSDDYQVAILALAPASILRAFGLRPGAQDSQLLLGPVLGAIQETTDPDELRALAQAVQTLGSKLAPEQAQAALGPVLDAIRQATDLYQFNARARVGQTADVRSPTRTITAPHRLQALVEVVRVLGPAPEQAHDAIAWIVGAIRQVADPAELRDLAEALQVLGPTAHQTHAGLGQVIDLLHQSTDPDQLQDLARAAKALGATHQQVQVAIGPILDSLRQITGPGLQQVEPLAQTIQALDPTPEQAQAALNSVFDALRQDTDTPEFGPARGEAYQLRILAQIGQALGPTSVHAPAALGPVLDAVRQTTTPHHFPTPAEDAQALANTVVQAFQALGPTTEQTQAALRSLLDTLRRTTDPYELQALSLFVRALGLTPEQAQTAIGHVLNVVSRTAEANELYALAQALQALDPSPEQARAALGPVLDAIQETTAPFQLQALAQAVQTLGPKLAAEQAKGAIETSRSVLAAADEPDVAEAFARAIAVTLALNPAERQPYVAAIVELLKWPTTAQPGATEALLEVLHDRVPKAPGKEAGLDATVRWVATTFPEIDLDSAPTPPASGSTGGAW